MEALLGFALAIAACAWLALTIWFVVVAVRFLRSGRKAFDRYVALTGDQAVREFATRYGIERVASPPPAPPAPKW